MDRLYLASTLQAIALLLIAWRKRGGGWISKTVLVVGVICAAASLFLVLTTRVPG